MAVFPAPTSSRQSRPDLIAYKQSLTLEFPALVTRLVALIGRKLTAYVASVKDTRSVDGWIKGNTPYGDVEPRLRLTFHIAQTLNDHDSPRVVQAWLTGVNPELGDRVPVRLLREGDLNVVAAELLGAARAFVAGG
jgi:hypothetical protein